MWPKSAKECRLVTTVQITLPDDLAQDVANAGLLESEALEDLLRVALRAVRLHRLDAMLATARSDPAELTHDALDTEIAAYRAEARRAAGA